MTADVAFEVHAFNAGKWKIQGFFDDKDLALSEARRMEEGRRYPAVRVVEERYDVQAGGYRSRTVYRSSAVDSENDTALKERAQIRREVQEQRQARSAASARPPKPPRSPALVYATIAAKALLIFAFGFGAIYALNQLAGS